MTPNLLHYSNHSQKISPAELEMNKTPPEYKSWKSLVAFFIDFYVVAVVASLMTFIFQAAVSTLMATPKMTHSLKMIDMNSLSFSILPLMLVSYFFISFYMNDGQTYGMKKMKIRYANPSYSIKESLVWAVRSASVIMTFGLSMFFLKDLFREKTVIHDHLYQSMMLQTEWAAPSLLERTTLQENAVEEHFVIAA